MPPFFGPRAGRSSKIEIKNCESHKFERHVSRPREMPVQSTFRDDPLKNKMLLRLPEKSLTDKDIKELLEQSGMILAEIEEWTSHFQFRRKNLTEGELTAYLRRETPVNKHPINRKMHCRASNNFSSHSPEIRGQGQLLLRVLLQRRGRFCRERPRPRVQNARQLHDD